MLLVEKNACELTISALWGSLTSHLLCLECFQSASDFFLYTSACEAHCCLSIALDSASWGSCIKQLWCSMTLSMWWCQHVSSWHILLRRKIPHGRMSHWTLNWLLLLIYCALSYGTSQQQMSWPFSYQPKRAVEKQGKRVGTCLNFATGFSYVRLQSQFSLGGSNLCNSACGGSNLCNSPCGGSNLCTSACAGSSMFTCIFCFFSHVTKGHNCLAN